MRLGGRRILVTGGSSGIGRQLVASYSEAGARVLTTARREPELAAAVEPWPAAQAVAADLTTAAGREAVAAAATGGLDVVVHAAGALGPRATLAEYPPDAWQRVLDINLTAVQRLHQAVLPLLDPTATIIGVSSSVGRRGRGGWGMYAVSKAALEGWLEVLADEWSGRTYSVNPGGTATPMRAEAMPAEDPATIPAPVDIMPVFLYLARADCPEPSGAKLDARDWIGRDPWA